jgi:hypothetical protein
VDVAVAVERDGGCGNNGQRPSARCATRGSLAPECRLRSAVAGLHLYAGRCPDDARLAELSVRDTDFRSGSADHDVYRHSHGAHRLRHPVTGDTVLNYETLTHTADPEQFLGLHTAEPGSPSERALRLLARHAAR